MTSGEQGGMPGGPASVHPSPEEVAGVAVFRERHTLPGLVDVHTHFAPPNVEAKVFAYFDAHGPLTGQPWPITYRVEEAARVAVLRAFGVRRFTSMIYPHKPDMAQWLNAWAVEFASRTPGCARTATFYPEPGAAAYVEDALAGGARIFKCHVQVGGFDPRDPLLDPVWGQLAEAGVPTVIHTGSGPAPGAFTGPEPVREVLAQHPRLPLVIAHLGMPEYAAFLDLAATHERVWLDTTMAFTDFSERMMPFPVGLRPRLADLGHRIVLGSDLPTIPYPYLHQLESLERLGLGSDWLRAVCWDNGIHLLG
jgi:predicted TIM-barrel fold metal-dependent hydrolase